MKTNITLFLCLALIQALDTGNTMIAINYSGIGLNLLLTPLMSKFGNTETLVFIKISLLFLILISVIKNVRYIRAGLVFTCGYCVIGLSLGYLFL